MEDQSLPWTMMPSLSWEISRSDHARRVVRVWVSEEGTAPNTGMLGAINVVNGTHRFFYAK
jgi:hypothetical protein